MRKIFITLILMLSIFSIANAHPFKSEKELQDFYAKIDKEVDKELKKDYVKIFEQRKANLKEKASDDVTEKNLEDCYKNTLNICLENGIKSLAFCCISTGEFHFPNKRAAEIAVNTVLEWSLKHPNSMERIIFNVFKDEDRRYYEELL